MTMPLYKPGNSVPMTWSLGLKDNSTRARIYTPPVLPIHVPLFFGYAPRGQTDAQLVNGGLAAEHYGQEIFDLKGKYATIVSPFLRLMNEYSNPFLFKRLKPKDAAAPASLCLALEVVETDKFVEYERKRSGHHVYDQNNMRIPTSSQLKGIVARWKILPAQTDPNKPFGSRTTTDGTSFYKNDLAAPTTIYPIFEFSAQWFGEYGNNVGLRFIPLRMGMQGFNSDLMKHQRTFLYNIQVLTRSTPKDSGVVRETIFGANGVVGSFKEGAYNKYAGDKSIDFNEIFLDSYRDLSGTGGRSYQYGDIGDFYIYQDNIEEVLTKMYNAEREANGVAVEKYDSEDIHVMNFLSGVDELGRPYRAVEVVGYLEGARIGMNEMYTHWFSGGFDGTMNNTLYDELVCEEFKHFGKLETKFLDSGRYPVRQIYDVGFSTKTKNAIIPVIGKRQDANITMSTCDFITNGNNLPPNLEDEASIGASLTAMIRGFPESVVWGTSAYRGLVVPQAGKLIRVPGYRKYVPATYQVAKWRAQYMSESTGMKKGYGYDKPPYNHVDELKDVTNIYADPQVWEHNWGNGMTHFRHKTDRLLFCPGLKTVYKDDTSVLTSDITMQVTCDINAYMFTVWANLSGRSDLTDQELIDLSNEMVTEFTRLRYDGRVSIVPETHLTHEDENNGYSWTMRVNMYANPMRTQMGSYIVSYRFGG